MFDRKRKKWLIIGACIGMLAGILVGPGIASSLQKPWELLGHPQGVVSAILTDGVNAYVQTTDGKIHQVIIRNCQRDLEPCWDPINSTGAEALTPVGVVCSSSFVQMRKPPFPMLQCVSLRGNIGGEYLYEENYALLEDGNIWVWEHSGGFMSSDTYGEVAVKYVVSPFIGILAGLIGAVILSRLFSHATDRPENR